MIDIDGRRAFLPDETLDIIRSLVIDGHEVVWATQTGPLPDGGRWSWTGLGCECSLDPRNMRIESDGGLVRIIALRTDHDCRYRRAARDLRYSEVRAEITARWPRSPLLRLPTDDEEIILWLWRRHLDGEWIGQTDTDCLYIISTVGSLLGDDGGADFRRAWNTMDRLTAAGSLMVYPGSSILAPYDAGVLAEESRNREVFCMTLNRDLNGCRCRIEHDTDTGQYFAINDELHVIAEGDTQAEAEARFCDAFVELVEYCRESGLPLPNDSEIGGRRSPIG